MARQVARIRRHLRASGAGVVSDNNDGSPGSPGQVANGECVGRDMITQQLFMNATARRFAICAPLSRATLSASLFAI